LNTQSKSQIPVMPDAQTVTSVKHWTDRLFPFELLGQYL